MMNIFRKFQFHNIGTPVNNFNRCLRLKNSQRINFSSEPSYAVKTPKKIADIFTKRPASCYTIQETASVYDAISHLVQNNLGSSLTIDSNGEITGVFTARDLLKQLHQHGLDNQGQPKAMSLEVKDVRTRREKMIFCTPSDTVRHCRETMTQCRIRNLPVIDNGVVLGIVTMKDLADSAFDKSIIGGKEGFIKNVIGRRGIPEGTVLNQVMQDSLANTKVLPQLQVATGIAELTHPFKFPNGVAGSRRAYGPNDYCDDLSLCEDAHFVSSVKGPLKQSGVGKDPTQTYICVADGVGSWRSYGVDPREYSHTLVRNAQTVVEEDEQRRVNQRSFLDSVEPIHPYDVLVKAWHATGGEGWSGGVTGSCCICLAMVDPVSNQLFYSNVGDCGLMVLRHIDSQVAGYMRERRQPRHLRKSDLRLAYLSQQQIKSFNHPYQLGFSDIPDHPGQFETPSDADTASIPVMAGDVVIMATDGLFDNMEIDEIVSEVITWELEHIPPNSKEPTLADQTRAVQALADRLTKKARELSLDTSRDSPFALLAKDNDILWSGGMPDDCTVAVLRLTNAPE